jgi:hypothetical protein
MFAQEGIRAGHRFERGSFGQTVRCTAHREGLHPAALGAVLAIETHARGQVWRLIERASARVFLALGLSAKVEGMSVGIAQIQPRRLSHPIDLAGRLRRLRQTEESVDLCGQILAEICLEARIPLDSSQWSRGDWRTIARSYSGDDRYADALMAAYRVLARKEFAQSRLGHAVQIPSG